MTCYVSASPSPRGLRATGLVTQLKNPPGLHLRQVMLKDMEHSKKALEDELQKTSEVRHEPGQFYTSCQ